MNSLEKIASYSTSRLEKIAGAITAIEEGYNPDEVMEFAAENGIHPEEIIMGNNLFEAELEKEAAEQELYKLASIIDSPETLPLVKVAAAVDLFAEGGITADDAYAIGETYGFDGSDVDYIFEQSFPELAKQAEENVDDVPEQKEEGKTKTKPKGPGIWDHIKGAYSARDIREGFAGDERDWGRIAKGAGKTGLAYGLPAGAAYYGYTKYKQRQDDNKGRR